VQLRSLAFALLCAAGSSAVALAAPPSSPPKHKPAAKATPVPAICTFDRGKMHCARVKPAPTKH
jgi:hypothetical protein